MDNDLRERSAVPCPECSISGAIWRALLLLRFGCRPPPRQLTLQEQASALATHFHASIACIDSIIGHNHPEAHRLRADQSRSTPLYMYEWSFAVSI